MPLVSPFCAKLAEIAQDQHSRFHRVDENDEPLRSQIVKYWTDLEFNFPGIEEAWSAVFVSWCIKQAGATKTEFHFSSAHAKFIYESIANTKYHRGVFKGHDIANYAPKVGDIIQNNRLGKNYTFKYAATHSAYKSHSAIVVETGIDSIGRYALTIGGNESDSVRSKIVRLNHNGLVQQRDANPYICAVETIK